MKKRIVWISSYSLAFFMALGVGVAQAAGVGDTCGNASTPPLDPGRWYQDCVDLASSCAGDVSDGMLCCSSYNALGGCIGGTCKHEGDC